MNDEFLYKYLDVSGALFMLTRKELQFTNPYYFNDPFDAHPGLLDHEVPDGYTRGWAPKSFICEKSFCDSVNNRRRAWISCLSKSHDDILMWSYYTNHKGVCISLRKNKLDNLLSNRDLGMTSISGIDVEYRDILQKPSGINGKEDPFIYQLRTKGKSWQHEQEVRYIIIEPHPWIPFRVNRWTSKDEHIDWKEVRFYPQITTDCFECVYLGARISNTDKLRILKAVNSSVPGISVFQLVPDSDHFAFVEELVDVEKYLLDHKESSLSNIWYRIKNWFPFSVNITYKRERIIRRNFRL